MKKISPLIIAVVLLVFLLLLGAIAFTNYQNNSADITTGDSGNNISMPTSLPTKSKPVATPALKMNFSRKGNVLNWDANKEVATKNWILLYEDPGKPAESVGLVFNQNSICNSGKKDEVCSQNFFSNGDLVLIEGNRQADLVTVFTAQKLEIIN